MECAGCGHRMDWHDDRWSVTRGRGPVHVECYCRECGVLDGGKHGSECSHKPAETVEEIAAAVARIAAAAHDPEAAHSMESTLWCNTLALIADGAADPQSLAREALKTRGLDFERW